MKCKECVTECSGAGKEGVATTCSYYRPGKKRKVKVKVLEITCCGECPYYNPDRDYCTKGAEEPAEDFFADCPLEEA